MTESSTGEAKKLDIRKYPNRRYYDSTRSRHLTLEEIYAAIREGYEVTVTDSKTGQDITAKVLAQIIIDLDARKLGVFPVALLHRLLRSNEQILHDFVEKYFNQALDGFLNSRRTVEQYFRQAIGVPAATAAEQWAKTMMGPFNPSVWAGQAPSAGPAPEPDLRRSVADLEAQIAQLKQHLKRGGGNPPKRSKKATSKRRAKT